MGASPRVSVLMPVHNGERFVEEAVESILGQTFGDYEFIILDDGSTDDTGAILRRCADPRIVRIDQGHSGLAASLNRGLSVARGDYIARMDSDDRALPERLEREVAFLDRHPEVGIVGTAFRPIDQNGRVGELRRLPQEHIDIRWASLLANPFAHPTVAFRRDLLDRHGLSYDGWLAAVEDYDLWTRMLRHTRGANLREPLLHYREHGASVTGRQREMQLRNHDAIAFRTIREVISSSEISLSEVSRLRCLFTAGDERESGPESRRAEIAEHYLDLLDAFIELCPGEAGVGALRRREALRVARLALRPPLPSGWRRLLGRALAMDPGLPWRFLADLSMAAGRRLRRSLNATQPGPTR